MTYLRMFSKHTHIRSLSHETKGRWSSEVFGCSNRYIVECSGHVSKIGLDLVVVSASKVDNQREDRCVVAEPPQTNLR